jgi:hypothetical protein
MTIATRELTIDDFTPRIGKTVEVEAGGGRVALLVRAAQPLPASGRQGGSFRLELLGPANAMLGQGLFPFAIGKETFLIFIVPLRSDARGVLYEAIFY